ncbi:MAG: transglutaminase-like domain-containing protein [Planctomycetes bacterium]|nr:transglutaminase-like domain-containing protein [Planctomycetota bacterium]MBU4399151.1 transglutaminase-like domain-containing protein [Planctomycetota bacterium]MCG2685206.1 transglutaminase-like domain-containing protein [Planctomycetales bacterium]
MLMRLGIIATLLWLVSVAPASAQFKQGEAEGPKVGNSQVTRWRVGVEVTASSGACLGGNGYISVPADWPEQEASVVEEDVSPEIKIRYSTIAGGVKLMNIKMGRLAAGQKAKALVTFEVRRSTMLPPEDTDRYVLPDEKKLPREIRLYLTPSPKIESRSPRIRELAKTIGAGEKNAWKKVEAIYDWVREKVKYQNGPLKGALAALKDGAGDCEELTSLFIAICRAAGVPARTVWVPGHCYPEFYLCDESGKGHWFPCQAAGTREFGGITETRPVLQKGDNFRPPIKIKGKNERRRYLDFDMLITGKVSPQVRSFREQVAK